MNHDQLSVRVQSGFVSSARLRSALVVSGTTALLCTAQTSSVTAPNPTIVRSLCLSPTLASAGLTANTGHAVLQTVAATAELVTAAFTTRQSVEATLELETQAIRAIDIGGVTPARALDLEFATGTLAAARAAYDAIMSQLESVVASAIASQVGTPGVTDVSRMRANRSRIVPLEFTVLEITEAQWRTLEIASRKAQLGDSMNSEEAGLLAAVQASPAVALASERITANAAAIEVVMQAAFPIPPSTSQPLRP